MLNCPLKIYSKNGKVCYLTCHCFNNINLTVEAVSFMLFCTYFNFKCSISTSSFCSITSISCIFFFTPSLSSRVPSLTRNSIICSVHMGSPCPDCPSVCSLLAWKRWRLPISRHENWANCSALLQFFSSMASWLHRAMAGGKKTESKSIYIRSKCNEWSVQRSCAKK